MFQAGYCKDSFFTGPLNPADSSSVPTRKATTVRRRLAAVFVLGVCLACSEPFPSRQALNGSKWLGRGLKGVNNTTFAWLLEFTDSTARLGNTSYRYAIAGDTVLLISSDPGMAVGFLAKGDSLVATDLSIVLRRAR